MGNGRGIPNSDWSDLIQRLGGGTATPTTQTIYPGGYSGWRPGMQRYAPYIPSGERSLMGQPTIGGNVATPGGVNRGRGYWSGLEGIMGPGAGLANWWQNQGRFQENPQMPMLVQQLPIRQPTQPTPSSAQSNYGVPRPPPPKSQFPIRSPNFGAGWTPWQPPTQVGKYKLM